MGGGALKGGMEMGMDGLRGGGVKRETERQFKKRGGGGALEGMLTIRITRSANVNLDSLVVIPSINRLNLPYSFIHSCMPTYC